jgi:hypothetical protein
MVTRNEQEPEGARRFASVKDIDTGKIEAMSQLAHVIFDSQLEAQVHVLCLLWSITDNPKGKQLREMIDLLEAAYREYDVQEKKKQYRNN